MLKWLTEMYKSKRETINYLFFGATTTFVNWIVYTLAVTFAAIPISVSNVIAWVVAVAFAYVTNKLWVFESRSWKAYLVLREAGSFIGSRLATGALEMFGVPFLVFAGLSYPLLGIPGFAAKVAVSVVVVILNYILSKLFVFHT